MLQVTGGLGAVAAARCGDRKPGDLPAIVAGDQFVSIVVFSCGRRRYAGIGTCSRRAMNLAPPGKQGRRAIARHPNPAIHRAINQPVALLAWPSLRKADGGTTANKAAYILAAVPALGMIITLFQMFQPHASVAFKGKPSALVPAAKGQEQKHWSSYGNTAGGSRFAALDQITRDNVKNLQVAWTDFGTPEDDQLDVLATLVEAYETKHFPWKSPTRLKPSNSRWSTKVSLSWISNRCLDVPTGCMKCSVGFAL
jgi:hypothetical protein